jgi:hypothetical protein
MTTISHNSTHGLAELRPAVHKLSQINICTCDRQENGKCLDPELPGTGLQEKGEKGSGPPSPGKKSQLEPSRDEGTMGRDKEKPIPYVMEEDQQPTE